ncbi:SDR family NAD(P)-dependent oxidoreductase [Streptomyces sp. NPDC050560]|uniref:SDR family NAD(P)-dependent oxidoreductase n=1 Tax=Streptomyces sp. NPDC050560 TaxID=3365630 RepID=UPI0037AEBB4C
MARTAVVTGGGTGIGREVARRLAAEGAEVVVAGRRREVLEKTAADLPGAVRPVAFDAASPEAVAEALGRLPERVDVLVNNAGGAAALDRPAPEPGDLRAVRDAWYADMDLNLMTTVLVTEALEPRLGDGARVVSLSSLGSRNGEGAYGAMKAAVESWNVGLARRLGPRGITANVVSPGLVEDTEFFRGLMTDDWRQSLVSRSANGRAGSPDDIAAAVCFLASPGAGHVTGQVLHVNGGSYNGL